MGDRYGHEGDSSITGLWSCGILGCARPFPTEAQPSKPSSHTTARTAPSCQPRYWLSVTGELCGGEIYACLGLLVLCYGLSVQGSLVSIVSGFCWSLGLGIVASWRTGVELSRSSRHAELAISWSSCRWLFVSPGLDGHAGSWRLGFTSLGLLAYVGWHLRVAGVRLFRSSASPGVRVHRGVGLSCAWRDSCRSGLWPYCGSGVRGFVPS